MSNQYFSADYHFGHQRICEYVNRPFKNVVIMDNQLIKLHNSIVEPEDEIYIVGDLTLKTAQYRSYIENILKKMNGIKHLILGNHDDLKPFTYQDIGICSVHTWLEIRQSNFEAILVHDPAMAQINRNKLFLCGHVHDQYKTSRNIINVGVDVHDYMPLPLQKIIELRSQMDFNETKSL